MIKHSLIKQKLADDVYEVYIGANPATVHVPVYREDYFSFTMIGFNQADDTPFDLDIFDGFNVQQRLFSPEYPTVKYELDPDNEIILGQSDLAVSERDELHIVSEDVFDIALHWKTLWMDIEAFIGGEKYTVLKISASVETDVTRITQ